MSGPAKGAQRPVCWFCGSAPAVKTIRLQPKHRGGRAEAGNVVDACQTCQWAKGIATLEEYREIRRRTLEWNGPPVAVLRFAGEGGRPIRWEKPRSKRGRPRKPVETQGIACACGRWIPASQLAAHLTRCTA